MKFYININQQVLSKTKLDLKDAAILEYIRGWCQSDDPNVKQLTLREDGIDYKYTWINFGFLIKEMPLLKFNQKASVSERIENIKKEGFIKTFQSPENSLYVRLMPKIKELEFEGGAVSLNLQGVSQSEQGVLAKTNSTNNILIQTVNSALEAKAVTKSFPTGNSEDGKDTTYTLTDDEGNELVSKKTKKDTRAQKLCHWYQAEIEKITKSDASAYIKGGYFPVKEALKKHTEEELRAILDWYLDTAEQKYWHIGNALSGKSIVKYQNQ